MLYIALGRPEALPADFLSCFTRHQRPPFSEVRELASKDRLPTTDAGIVLLFRQPSPPPAPGTQRPVGRTASWLNEEPIRILCASAHAPLGHAGLLFHSFLPPENRAHPTNARAFLLVDRYERLHPVVATQLLEVPCTGNVATDGGPPITLSFPEGPGIVASIDYFGPLPVMPRGNSYILLFTDRFSRRADMFPDTSAEFTAVGTASILLNRYVPLWGYPRSILSDNGFQLCSKLSHAVCQLLGLGKIATSSYHPNGNERWGGTRKPHDGSDAGKGRQRAPKQPE